MRWHKSHEQRRFGLAADGIASAGQPDRFVAVYYNQDFRARKGQTSAKQLQKKYHNQSTAVFIVQTVLEIVIQPVPMEIPFLIHIMI